MLPRVRYKLVQDSEDALRLGTVIAENVRSLP